jgi:hypothetical protein
MIPPETFEKYQLNLQWVFSRTKFLSIALGSDIKAMELVRKWGILAEQLAAKAYEVNRITYTLDKEPGLKEGTRRAYRQSLATAHRELVEVEAEVGDLRAQLKEAFTDGGRADAFPETWRDIRASA